MLEPYPDNQLTKYFPGPLSAKEICRIRTTLPNVPRGLADIPKESRCKLVMHARNLHIPAEYEPLFVEKVDQSLHETLSYLNPALASAWTVLSGECSAKRAPRRMKGLCIAVEGVSGVGKSTLCSLTFDRYPAALVHSSMPGMKGPATQLVHIAAEIPASGRALDLAKELGRRSDELAETDRFKTWRDGSKQFRPSDGLSMLNEWWQYARSCFLGILHLDDVHNLFRLVSLRERGRKGKGGESPQLSIVEDETLRWLDQVINSGSPAVVISGTSDGIVALQTRFSTAQRMTSMGHFELREFRSPDEIECQKYFEGLASQQYVARPLELNNEAITRILELTGGVRRIIMHLWIHAQTLALLDSDRDALEMTDIEIAAMQSLSPVKPAIDALRKGDANAARNFEDLLPRNFRWPA